MDSREIVRLVPQTVNITVSHFPDCGQFLDFCAKIVALHRQVFHQLGLFGENEDETALCTDGEGASESSCALSLLTDRMNAVAQQF